MSTLWNSRCGLFIGMVGDFPFLKAILDCRPVTLSMSTIAKRSTEILRRAGWVSRWNKGAADVRQALESCCKPSSSDERYRVACARCNGLSRIVHGERLGNRAKIPTLLIAFAAACRKPVIARRG